LSKNSKLKTAEPAVIKTGKKKMKTLINAQSELSEKLKTAKITIDGNFLRISKINNASNHLEIFLSPGTTETFGLNIVGHPIENLPTEAIIKWYGNKYYTLVEVLNIAKQHGIK